ncbi:DUF1576 domain-containing protein [Enterococcus sp. LJL120]
METNFSQKIAIFKRGDYFDNQKLTVIFTTVYTLSLLAFGMILSKPQEIIKGLSKIFNSPSHLITDYFAFTNFGSVFINSGLLTMLSLIIAIRIKVPMDTKFVAAIFSVSGFSFFGKNLFNSLPIIIGIWLYSKAVNQPLNKHFNTALFGSSLSPVISYLAFGLKLPLAAGIFIGLIAGILMGFFLPLLADHFFHFHKGYNLYNVGFASGIISMFIMGVLTIFGQTVETVNLISDNAQRPILIFLIGLCLTMILVGALNYHIEVGKNQKVFDREKHHVAVGLINMGALGIFLIGYIILIGGDFNGPILGSILTIIGFAPLGIRVNKAWPILCGAFLAKLFGIVDIASCSAIMSALFALGLTPLSRRFGIFAGIIAGVLHISIVGNIFFLHGGLNLYNNGFTCGFVAAFLLPIFEYLKTSQLFIKVARQGLTLQTTIKRIPGELFKRLKMNMNIKKRLS